MFCACCVFHFYVASQLKINFFLLVVMADKTIAWHQLHCCFIACQWWLSMVRKWWPCLFVWNTEDPQDIYWLAQCLYLTSQYHRASHALRSRKLDKVIPGYVSVSWQYVQSYVLGSDRWGLCLWHKSICERCLSYCMCFNWNQISYNNISSIISIISVPGLKQHLSSCTQTYGACQYLAARCHVSNWKMCTV